MSGHSKWATIKRKKGAIDAARGKIFAKMSRQLEVATREGGGDPASNATLRTIIQKAKAAHMTNDAIDRAIKPAQRLPNAPVGTEKMISSPTTSIVLK